MQGGGGKKDKKDRLGSVAVRHPYLHVVGLVEEVEGAHTMPTFTYVPVHPACSFNKRTQLSLSSSGADKLIVIVSHYTCLTCPTLLTLT